MIQDGEEKNIFRTGEYRDTNLILYKQCIFFTWKRNNMQGFEPKIEQMCNPWATTTTPMAYFGDVEVGELLHSLALCVQRLGEWSRVEWFNKQKLATRQVVLTLLLDPNSKILPFKVVYFRSAWPLHIFACNSKSATTKMLFLIC